ncbi:MAG: biopolymer transporter ExbD [Candidatus Mcinerneyibacterium aminivorans]|uniref:Biopolymer transporter ExbD n=1 Tax=Candidatus Mcinerneyibacterium aminivorans TaxID=2703815 RepID=A0A5D0M9E4_9BACT|nr:MAG: biopolymer transporter ExbD [Candidatus Mcinerneyibacterium aminivorans]
MAVIKKEKRKGKVNIPTASMADIAFLLLIFFMVTTVFKVDTGIKLTLPSANEVQKVKRKDLAIVWVNESGKIAIEDKFVPMEYVSRIIREKNIETNGRLVVEIKADKEAKYGYINQLFEQLKKAQAVRVVLGANVEGSRG